MVGSIDIETLNKLIKTMAKRTAMPGRADRVVLECSLYAACLTELHSLLKDMKDDSTRNMLTGIFEQVRRTRQISRKQAETLLKIMKRAGKTTKR